MFVSFLWALGGELGMVWDEPPGVEREEAVRIFVRRLLAGPAERAAALSPAGIERGWRFCREPPDEHPPLQTLLSLGTGNATEWLLGPLRARRLATVLVFAVTTGVVFRLVQRQWGWVAGIAAAGGLIFQPRFLGDAQLATFDAMVAGFWFFAAAAFLKSCATGWRPWLFGVLAGLAVMAKATGILVFPAVLLWTLCYRPKGAWRQFAWALLVCPLVMLALHPGWWMEPLAGPLRWAQAMLHYKQRVRTYYLGHLYDQRTTFLPWHNPWVLLGVMVPAGLLALAIAGLTRAGWLLRRVAEPGPTDDNLRPTGPFGSDGAVAGWALVNFLLIVALRMAPVLPAHDGLRQMAPAFPFFAVLVGFGARTIMEAARGAAWAKVLVLAVVAAAGWETVRVHPYELEYYNLLSGGARGAKAMGMETTYYWDAANQDVLEWMNRNLPRHAVVLIFPYPDVQTFALLQRWGRLRSDLEMVNFNQTRIGDGLQHFLQPRPAYMIFLMRQSLYVPPRAQMTRLFLRLSETPADYELIPPALGVRILAVFNQGQVRQVMREVGLELSR